MKSLVSKVRVAMVDDLPLLRRGVKETLSEEADLELVGVGETAPDAVRLAREQRPDLMLLDIALPGGGIEALKEIVKSYPDIKVVILTVCEDQATVKAALRAGARGYLVKGVDGPELVSTLRKINSGQGYVTPALAAQLLSETEAVEPGSAIAGTRTATLTKREQQIVTLLSKGLSNHKIAEKLGLTENTVKHYMTPILQKLGARNRTEAAIIARSENAIRGSGG